MIRRGHAEIKVIENGFLLYHDFPSCTSTLPIYFATLDEIFAFLDAKVFCEIK